MEKLHQSPMIGEVLAGILVGPMVLGLINPDPTTSFGESLNVVDDLGAFAMLGLVVQFTSLGASTPEGLTIGLVAVNNVLFVGLVFCVATILKLTTRLRRNSESYMQTFVSKLRGQEASFALCVSTALGLGAAAELLGIHFAVGAFYGGLLMTPQLLGQVQFNRVRNAVSSVTFGLFAPVFFAFVGLKFSVSFGAWPLIVAITAIAFIGKLLGGLMGGFVAGFRGAPLVALGVGLNARGMMELLLAQVGFATGIIDASLYSALVVMTLTTTLCTPPLLKRLLRRFKVEDILPPVPGLVAVGGIGSSNLRPSDETTR